MRGRDIFWALAALSFFFTVSAIASSGNTANGCSYKVINGQYLTDCSNQRSAPPAAEPAAPVTSYGDVPVRHNAGAYAPSLPPPQPTLARSREPVVSALADSPSETSFDAREESRRELLRTQFVDQTYVGVLLGASNMKESNTGSTTGIGLDIGTNIDDHLGVELGYSYGNQKLNMGLANRDSTTSSLSSPGIYAPSSYDAELSTHLFTGEIQAHLTDPLKRLRPYLGAGLGWRAASLSENRSDQNAYGQTLSGGTLRQNSFGGLASVGAKLRVAKTLQLGVAFRYFFPFARQDARLEQPLGADRTLAGSDSRLQASDDLLTGSSQYQVLGGLQYSF